MDAMDLRRADRSIGVVATALAVVGAICVLAPLPWEVRFPVVVLACLVGPGIPALRLWTSLDLWTACVVGLGVDVALVMVVAQAMVLIGLWGPSVGVLLLLVAAGAVGVMLAQRAARHVEGGDPA